MGGKGGSSNRGEARGAAEETGEQARELAREQTYANRPNQYNPWGSTEWTSSTDPRTGMERWEQNETLNPALQASLDQQLSLQQSRGELAGGSMEQLRQNMSQPHDFDQYGSPVGYDPAEQRQASEDAAYGRATSRLDPQYEQRAQEMEINLRNKGLRAGDAAYDAQMQTFDRGRNDAYEQARMGSTLEGRQEVGVGLEQNQRANALRQQQIQEDLQRRGYPLEEVNRLMAGQEIEGATPSAQEKATIADKLSG